MKYPKKVTHRGIKFIGYLHAKKGLVVYRARLEWGRFYTKACDSIGVLALGPGWQDGDRVWTAQDIYWEDKYDCKLGQREAA